MLGSCLVASDRQLATKRQPSQTLAGSDHYPITLYCCSFPCCHQHLFSSWGRTGGTQKAGVSLLQGEIRTLLRVEEEPSTSFTCQSAPVCAITGCSLTCMIRGCSLLCTVTKGTRYLTCFCLLFFFLLQIWT